MAYYLRISRADNHQIKGGMTERDKSTRRRAGDIIEQLPGNHVFGAKEFLTANYGLVRINDPNPSATMRSAIDSRDQRQHLRGSKFIAMATWLASLTPRQRTAFNGATQKSEILTLANSSSLEAAIGVRGAIT